LIEHKTWSAGCGPQHHQPAENSGDGKLLDAQGAAKVTFSIMIGGEAISPASIEFPAPATTESPSAPGSLPCIGALIASLFLPTVFWIHQRR